MLSPRWIPATIVLVTFALAACGGATAAEQKINLHPGVTVTIEVQDAQSEIRSLTLTEVQNVNNDRMSFQLSINGATAQQKEVRGPESLSPGVRIHAQEKTLSFPSGWAVKQSRPIFEGEVVQMKPAAGGVLISLKIDTTLGYPRLSIKQGDDTEQYVNFPDPGGSYNVTKGIDVSADKVVSWDSYWEYLPDKG